MRLGYIDEENPTGHDYITMHADNFIVIVKNSKTRTDKSNTTFSLKSKDLPEHFLVESINPSCALIRSCHVISFTTMALKTVL